MFEEFFEQGDLEKQMELPVSMLCDRKSTNVAGAQNGFINYVTMPLFTTLSAFVPHLAAENGAIANMKSNLEKWKSYVETEADKKVYQIKEQVAQGKHKYALNENT